MILITGSVQLRPDLREEAFALGIEHSARSRAIARRKGQCFDKLSMDGYGVGNRSRYNQSMIPRRSASACRRNLTFIMP
jgi:hypothetical protein